MQIDKLKGPLIHKHKVSDVKNLQEILDVKDNYRYWVLKTGTAEGVKYGYLYNAYIAINPLLPAANAHVPTITELFDLANFATSAFPLMSNSLDYWNFAAGTNALGFDARGAGCRDSDGSFAGAGAGGFRGLKNDLYLRSQTVFNDPFKIVYSLQISMQENENPDQYDDFATGWPDPQVGMSIRLVVDAPIEIDGNSAIYVGNDGRRYRCVLINGVWWMADNLMETKFSDGSLIPVVTDNVAWSTLETGARCVYNNDTANATEIVDVTNNIESHEVVDFPSLLPPGYQNWKLKTSPQKTINGGMLYNFFAVSNASPLSAANAHVPTGAEYNTLVAFLGGNISAGGKLKEVSDRWQAPNTGADNSTGFNGRGSGGRGQNGDFMSILQYGVFWTSTEEDANTAKDFTLLYNSSSTNLNAYVQKRTGAAVRLIVDAPIEIDGNQAIYVGNDGRRYNCVLIGAQWWMAENLAETKYRNGSLIPNVTDSVAWSALGSGAFSVYNNDFENAFDVVEATIESLDVLDVEPGDNITLDLQGKKLKISASGSVNGVTSDDGSLTVVENAGSYDLSVAQKGEFIAYADNEAELLTAWAAAVASNKAARIYVTNNITFTANRQFVQPNISPGIKIECIQNRYFIAANYTIDYNNVTMINCVFRTTGASYFRVVGGLATFQNCGWIDDTKDASLGGVPKKNMIVCDPITAGAAKIILTQTTHFTATPADNNASLIQPFWIENQASFVGDTSSLYVEVREMAAVSSFDRFSRILLTSAVASCPFKVTGDESWFYAPAQEMPGVGNISALASILRTTTVDKFNAPKLIADDAADYLIGMHADGTAVKKTAHSDDYYGIMWDVNVSSPACARIGKMELHRDLPLQSLMKGCLLKDDGTVNYYLDSLDWTKKADGTASLLDGTDGQVMVEIPSHYRKFETFLSFRKVKISQYPLTGFTYVPKFYISAYEATVQRSTSKLASVINATADYRGGNNNAAWDAETRTLLGRPATNISRIDFRTYARNRGSVNWNMITYDAYKSLFWLYFVEYANLNSQAAFNAAKDANGCAQGGLGNGVTTVDGTKWNTWNSYYPFVPCGQTNSLGNYSGEVSFNMPAEYDAVILTVKSNRYRGIENPFGHIYKWTDGVNVEMQAADSGALTKMWTCSNPANFSNIDYANYTLIGNLPRVDGYIKEMIFGEILPSNNVGGSSTTYFCDNGYYSNLPATGVSLRGVIFGGYAYNGSYAGFGCSNATNAPSNANALIGSRLCFLGA